MNKKLFSAALFGALLLGTASTFVSCKDYDDDIAGLQTQINDVKATVAALEAKVNAGKFVTGVNSTADGITISLSDGTSYTVTNGKNGTNGTNGVDGTNGAEWTISEDGFWVCNGEKTEILAVGQKGEAGENGQDAQPEVKKENGKWYLWNGEEFEEFTTPEAPATENIPYCFVDPNDANYMNLVVFTEAGEKVTMKLPLNEGLGQIKIEKFNFDVTYGMATSTSDKWDGDKAVPDKGEFIVGQSENSIIIEVTPTSYDLSGKILKAVNSLGEELPLELGAAVPYTGLLTRTASKTGLYEIPILGVTVNDETIESFKDKVAFSLVANENVYSGFTAGHSFQMTDFTKAANNTVSFGVVKTPADWTTTPVTLAIMDSNIKAKAGEAVTVENNNPGYLFDSYLTMAGTTAKADSVRYGIKIDGMTVTATENPNKKINLWVSYYTVDGKAHPAATMVTLDFTPDKPVVEVVGEIASVKHTLTVENAKTTAIEQSFVADLKPYFDALTMDRLIWNDDFQGMQLWNYEVEGTPIANVKWVFDDPNDGKTKTVYLSGLLKNITRLDADGEAPKTIADLAAIQLIFNTNYPINARDEKNKSVKTKDENGKDVNFTLAHVIEYGGQFTANIVVWGPDVDGDTSHDAMSYIEVPFTLEAPSTETLKAAYTFNASNLKDGVVTVIGNTITNAQAFSDGTVTYTTEKNEKAIAVDGSGNITLDTKNGGKYNTAYTLTNVKVTYLGVEFDVDDFQVMFVKGVDYTTKMPTGITLTSGITSSPVKVIYDTPAAKGETRILYGLYSVENPKAVVAASSLTFKSVKTDNAIITATFDATDGTTIILNATAEKITVATTVEVTVTFNDGKSDITGTFNVTVKPYPTAE